ncbi:hypothetical protein GCM10011591_31530 [Nocardia camponoti]|uniref:Uncharacterized protein n=1 Tax=Nocardia camponoti TaxID=1616106 RepID=A0A917VAY6_9NOCA|nr:hypothetical protein GCM10011591_31530 [Nocardia camponoti]
MAAGGGGTPIRPVEVEGTYTPPAYLLADAAGRLHTAGVERQRADLGMAIADVRDILGHPQIVIAGATWPAGLVFRARLYNPLAAIGKFLRGKPQLVALPYPDSWPEDKIEVYAALVEQLDVTVEPLPESVALSGYVRALGLVEPPSERHRQGIGATGIYSDGRTLLVVSVDGDDEQPTESVEVVVAPDALRDARSADNVVIEAMAAARQIGADTSTVLLAGNVCFNDALRLAFQNHLGQRLHVAEHPMHALVLGASHLLVNDPGFEEEEEVARPNPTYAAQVGWGNPTNPAGPPQQQATPPPGPAGFVSGPAHGSDPELARPSKLRKKLFGTPAVIGLLTLGLVGFGGTDAEANAADGVCSFTPYAHTVPPEGIASAHGPVNIDDPVCVHPGVDTLRYLIPGRTDPGPPVVI